MLFQRVINIGSNYRGSARSPRPALSAVLLGAIVLFCGNLRALSPIPAFPANNGLASLRATGVRSSSAEDQPGKPCLTLAEAAQPVHANQDICVQAHVYAVVELADGTRFMDVCAPDLPDDQCRFTLLSLPADRNDVGDLRKFRDQDVTVRGVARATRGRMGIVISHLRQFRGGPEKFRPNPKLLRGWDAQSNRGPVRDPNLAPSGGRRGFMNSREQEPLPARQKR
jgi:hypothetical protein